MNSKISKERFEHDFAKRSGIPLIDLLRFVVAVPCECDFEHCGGWKMENRETRRVVKQHLALN